MLMAALRKMRRNRVDMEFLRSTNTSKLFPKILKNSRVTYAKFHILVLNWPKQNNMKLSKRFPKIKKC